MRFQGYGKDHFIMTLFYGVANILIEKQKKQETFYIGRQDITHFLYHIAKQLLMHSFMCY